MPLAQLVQQPAAAVVPAAKREARRPRAPQQQDVCSLLVRVLLRLFRGEVLSLETVKAAWRELSFSFVFEAHLPGTPVDQHVQLLYAAALDRLLAPIPPAAWARALQPLRKQHEDALAAAAAAEQARREEEQQQEAQLREELLRHMAAAGLGGSDDEEEAAAELVAALGPLPLPDAAASHDTTIGLAAAAGADPLAAVPPLPLRASVAVPHCAGLLPGMASAAVATPLPAEAAALLGPASVDQLPVSLPAAEPAGAVASLSAPAGSLAADAPIQPAPLAQAPRALPMPAVLGAQAHVPPLLPFPAPAVLAGAEAGPAAPGTAQLAAGGLDLESLMLDFDEPQAHGLREEQQQDAQEQPQQDRQQSAAVAPADEPQLPRQDQPGAAVAALAALPPGLPQLPLLPFGPALFHQAPPGLDGAPPGLAELLQPAGGLPPVPPFPSEEELAALHQHSPQLQAAALLVLFCLHAAHPPLPAPGLRSVGEAKAAASGALAPASAAGSSGGAQRGGGGRVQIYLGSQHQAALLGVLPQLAAVCPDALQALRQLRASGALVAGAPREAPTGGEAGGGVDPLLPGAGLFHGMHARELALLREVRYQLDSSLRGLGTASLAQACGDYQDSLAAMWMLVTARGGGASAAACSRAEPPESIADLRLGDMLHEFAERKHAQLQLLLHHGRFGTAKLLAQAAEHRRATMAQRAAAERRRKGQQHRAHAEQLARRRLAEQALQGGGPQQEAPQLEQGGGAPSGAAAFEAAPAVKRALAKRQVQLRRAAAAASTGNVAGILNRVERREQQRQQDIQRRQNAWRQVAGLPEARTADDEGAAVAGDDAELSDMPDLPDMHDWEATAPAAFGRSQGAAATAPTNSAPSSSSSSSSDSDSGSDGSTSGSESSPELEPGPGRAAGAVQGKPRGGRAGLRQRPRQGMQGAAAGTTSAEAADSQGTEATVQQPAARGAAARGGGRAGGRGAAAAAGGRARKQPAGHAGGSPGRGDRQPAALAGLGAGRGRKRPAAEAAVAAAEAGSHAAPSSADGRAKRSRATAHAAAAAARQAEQQQDWQLPGQLLAALPQAEEDDYDAEDGLPRMSPPPVPAAGAALPTTARLVAAEEEDYDAEEEAGPLSTQPAGQPGAAQQQGQQQGQGQTDAPAEPGLEHGRQTALYVPLSLEQQDVIPAAAPADATAGNPNAAAESAALPPAKRRRGRPPKAKPPPPAPVQPQQPGLLQQNGQPAAPKRRGRPPKPKPSAAPVQQASPVTQHGEQHVAAPAPKRRGRPPKVQPEAAALERQPSAAARDGAEQQNGAAGPKRRGRPPKATPVVQPLQPQAEQQPADEGPPQQLAAAASVSDEDTDSAMPSAAPAAAGEAAGSELGAAMDDIKRLLASTDALLEEEELSD